MIDRFLWLLFSFRGRIGRATFAIFWLVQLVVWGSYQGALWRRYMVITYDVAHKAHAAINASPAVGGVIFFLSAVAVWITLAVQIKRLHDFSWSGWWLAAPIGCGVVGGFLVVLFAALHFRAGFILAGPLVAFSGVSSLVLAGLMFFRAGDPGENGHPRGPDEEALTGSASPSASSGPTARRNDARASSPSAARPARPGAAQTFGRRGAGG
jgi:uncharacterized membrane protein YhaH (DUF805 family)